VVSIAVFQGSYMWSFLVAVALCIIAWCGSSPLFFFFLP
jgi:hypothetical protein